jgi:diguanylate cyclase (GGDEF)-like protein
VAARFRDKISEASAAGPEGSSWLRLVGIGQSQNARKPWAIRDSLRVDSGAPETAFELISAIERSGQLWFWKTNAGGLLTYISPKLAERLGCAVEALLGTAFADLMSGQDDDFDATQVERTFGFTLSAKLAFTDFVVSSAGAEGVWWSLSGAPTKNAAGRFDGFAGHGSDLSDKEKTESETSRMALYDSLTALPNRRLMRNTLEELLKCKGNRATDCSLFLLDLDRFKNVNDTLGHPVGDALLQQVAKRLDHVVDDIGQVGRLGGDEFMVILPNMTDKEALSSLSDTIITRLSLPYIIDDTTVQIGASLGIALAPFDGDCPDELTRNADLALYAAKGAGKGTYRYYQPEMHAEATERRALENDLRDVLCLEQMDVVYQPIVDAQSELVVGFEALVRWNHPTRGPVPPATFIPIAEEVGLISRIGEWVLRTACMQAATWPDHLSISVNLSPVQFAGPGLVATIMNALADSGLPPNRLEIEITEGIFLDNHSGIDQQFSALQALGVRLVLDDFGTGYASLGYLNRVPLNKIKIDRSFVQGAGDEGKRNKAIIQAIVGLARDMNMETVAEGAETLDEVELIRALGCTQIQGFIFGKPMSGEDAGKHAKRSRPMLEAMKPEHIQRVPRVALLRFVKIYSEGQELTVKMRNISAIGALLEAEGGAIISSELLVEFSPEFIVPASVRWRKETRIGIEFAAPIDVEQAVHQGAPARVRRLG